MNEFLTSNLVLNREYYFRLLALVFLDTLVSMPLSIYSIWVRAEHGEPMRAWPGWTAVHSHYSEVWIITAEEWRGGTGTWGKSSVLFSEWIYVICAIFYIAFFSFTKGMLWWYARPFELVCGRFICMRRRGLTLPDMEFQGGESFNPQCVRYPPTSSCC